MTEQTVIVVTIRHDDTRRRRHVAACVRSVLHHPSTRGMVTYTVEDFPEPPPLSRGGSPV